MTNAQVFWLVTAIASVGVVDYNKEVCCDGEHDTIEQVGNSEEHEAAGVVIRTPDPVGNDGPLDFATLEPCTRQRITAVTYGQDGKPKHRSQIIWDGDHPGIESGDIVELINGWD